MSKKTSDVTKTWRLLALAAIATAALSPVAAATEADPAAALTPELRRALQRDLKMSPGEIARYLEIESTAIERLDDARRAFGKDFGGAWLEQDATGEYRLVIGTTTAVADSEAKRLGSTTRRVRHTLDRLNTAKSALDRYQSGKQVNPAIHGWYVDLPGNTLVVETDPDANAQQAAIEFIVASNADPAIVRLTTSKLRPQPAAYTMRGGDRYSTSVGACSIGFPVATTANVAGFVTAGHCGQVNQAVRGYNNVAMGVFAGSTFPGKDQAWVRQTSASWVARPWVYNYSGGNIAVVGNRETAVGGAVCRSGWRTGYRCGRVVAKNVTVNYGSSGIVYGLTRSTACVGQGDSGGSFITPGREAQGVTSGGAMDSTGHNCAVASPVTFHQPLQPILAAYQVAPLTVATCGRLNARWFLASGSGLKSCDGRFLLYMHPNGLLALYQYGVGYLWHNNVPGAGNQVSMQLNGNLMVRNTAGQAVWQTGTPRRHGASLFVQNDGNVVLRNHLGQALWWTGTGGR